jgi:hypothetical protein
MKAFLPGHARYSYSAYFASYHRQRPTGVGG